MFENDDEEVVVDGEVDEGDVHIKPVVKKPVPESLAVATLSDKYMAQRIHNLVDDEEFKRFFLPTVLISALMCWRSWSCWGSVQKRNWPWNACRKSLGAHITSRRRLPLYYTC